MKKILLYILLMVIAQFNLFSNQDSSANRTLLPYSINSYQPTLLPVITIDGSEMYLDRKWHPQNIGEGIDSDDIWISKKMQGNFWSELINVKNLNTKNPDILFSIVPDNNSAILYGNFIKDDSGFYIAKKNDRKWIIHERLKIINYYNNWDKFGCSISHDKKNLILALNRDDSYGGLDLYISFYDPYRKLWSAPQNIGKNINTSAIEAAPFLSYDNKTLYFASNGHKSYGKLDLFMSKREDDSWLKWSEPVNLGPLFNTAEDENSIWLTARSDTAYIASYDTLNKRSAIFSITMPDSTKPSPYYVLTGNIYYINKKRGTYNITISDSNGSIINSFESQDEKYYSILPIGNQYKLTAISSNCEEYSFSIKADPTDSISYLERDIIFKPIDRPKKRAYTIYFELNQSSLSNDNKQKIYAIMNNKDFPSEYKIEITGHADETGTDAYNTNLSYQRAKNVSHFLKNIGVEDENISVEWKGETSPISTNPEKNRRVEIIIIPM